MHVLVAKHPMVQALTHLGQLSLSVYVLHVPVVVLGHAWFPGTPLLTGILPAAVAFSLTALIGAHQWRRRYRRGPFEQLLRRLAG